MAICWESVVPLAFHWCCIYFSAALVVRVPFRFGVCGRMWNSIVSVPDHSISIYFVHVYEMLLKWHKLVNSQLSWTSNFFNKSPYSKMVLSFIPIFKKKKLQPSLSPTRNTRETFPYQKWPHHFCTYIVKKQEWWVSIVQRTIIWGISDNFYQVRV